MPTIVYDIETYSDLSLKKHGTFRYANDPSTDVWCVGYCVDDGDPLVWIPDEPVPQCFIDAAQYPANWILVAHNAMFDMAILRAILVPRYGWPLLSFAQHRCTMSMALALALPGSMELLAQALDLDLEKDKDGAALMRKLAKATR
jgi:DNA polymerase bacteriophage-type